VTSINYDVIGCIFGYLKINDSDICTICTRSFNDQLLLTPLCDCGKKLQRGDDIYYDEEFGKYCGKKENQQNIFHIKCFKQIASCFRNNNFVCYSCKKYYM